MGCKVRGDLVRRRGSKLGEYSLRLSALDETGSESRVRQVRPSWLQRMQESHCTKHDACGKNGAIAIF